MVASYEGHKRQTKESIIAEKLRWLRMKNNNRPFYQPEMFNDQAYNQSANSGNLAKRLIKSYKHQFDLHEQLYPQLKMNMSVNEDFNLREFMI